MCLIARIDGQSGPHEVENGSVLTIDTNAFEAPTAGPAEQSPALGGCKSRVEGRSVRKSWLLARSDGLAEDQREMNALTDSADIPQKNTNPNAENPKKSRSIL